MATNSLPEQTFLVVATGAEAKFFRNRSKPEGVELQPDGTLSPRNLMNEGPAGSRPPESSPRENNEATFSKQLAEYLYQQAHAGKYEHLALVADPNTLGELRPLLHQEVKDKMVLELGKTLIHATPSEIEKLLQSAD